MKLCSGRKVHIHPHIINTYPANVENMVSSYYCQQMAEEI